MLAIWIAKGQGALWRVSIWRDAGRAVDATARALGAEVRPLWTGYRVQQGDARVEWRGGLYGAYTRVRFGRDSERHDGLLASEVALGVLASLKARRRGDHPGPSSRSV